MSLESDLFIVLKPFVVTAGPPVSYRVFPDVAPTSTPKPYITWQQIGGDIINPLDNAIPGKRNASVQINVWATTRAGANALSKQIEDAVRQATAFQATPTAAAFCDYDYDMEVYGSQQEFSIWANG